MRILNSCAVEQGSILQTGVRQPVQPHTFCAWLLVFDETLAQSDFAVFPEVVISVSLPCF